MSTCSSIVFIYTEKRVKWKQKTKNKKKRKVGYEVRKERKKVNNVLMFPVQSISFRVFYLLYLPREVAGGTFQYLK